MSAATATMSEAEVKAERARENARKAKEKRESLPKYNVPQGGIVKVPADYSTSKFQPLDKSDFSTEANYLVYKADKLELAAKRARDAANDALALGNVKDAKKAKKLLKVAREFEELKAMLSGDSVDVDALLAMIASK